jgi:hypothetical protein
MGDSLETLPLLGYEVHIMALTYTPANCYDSMESVTGDYGI